MQFATGIGRSETINEMWVEHVDAPAAEFITERILDSQHLVGTPDEIGEKLQALQVAGANTFGTVTYAITDKRDMMREIASQVMPHFLD